VHEKHSGECGLVWRTSQMVRFSKIKNNKKKLFEMINYILLHLPNGNGSLKISGMNIIQSICPERWVSG
jgi:hypothetical protein